MGYKTILVHCDAGKTTQGRVAVAAELAERFDAHLVGLHVRQRFEAPMFSDATVALDALYQTYEQAVKTEEATSSAAFQGALSGKRRSSEWRVGDGYAEDNLTAAARYADLVVVGQREPEPTPESTPSDLPEKLALHSERPIMVVPHIGVTRPPGRTVMVCWNGRREASRAATGALPLLKAAERVILPAVREASAHTLLMTDGFSCRSQIEHGSERSAMHLAQVLQMALQRGPVGPAIEPPERAYAPEAAR